MTWSVKIALLCSGLFLLSGMLTPVRNMPEVLQIATYANPLRFGVDLVRRVYLEGAVFGDIAFDFLPLIVLSAVTLPLGVPPLRARAPAPAPALRDRG